MTPCPKCGKEIPENSFFCSYCGKKIKEPPVSVSAAKQIFMYAVSLFLPPLGLIWFVRYLRQPDRKAKNIAIAILVVTIAASLFTLWFAVQIMNGFTNSLNNPLNNTLNGYSF